ncbi:craniofacial development protein 2-like [Elysia marginata]|uniref:Craniofacial development protein 2-like n=1 Tax=Elysia marginata TaxID=1093978 RepID=A0AAV4JDI2_9GAST|nr:craniofacial development protein 2-like [Elysia marginata]
MRDFNAKVGTTTTSKSIGREGLGETNERGERLIQYWEKHELSIVNTLFIQQKRRLYTWKSPGDIFRNQIVYIAIKSRFKNAIMDCRTSPGADIGSDHNPVIMKMNLKLKKPNKKTEEIIKYDMTALTEGKVDGSRGRGRRRKSWITNIAEMTNMRVNAAVKAAMEREGWRSMPSNLFKEKEPL